MGNIDGFSRPPDKKRQKLSPKDEEALNSTRWLYEDDADFEHAKKKIASEISREELKKQLARKSRVKKAKNLAAKLKAFTKNTPGTIKKFLRLALNPRHRKKTAFATLGLVAVLVLGYIFMPSNPNAQVLGDDLPETPQYDTLIPQNDLASTTSDKLAYDRKKQVASFTDTIGEVPITISQQPLPERFKENPFIELASFAKEIGANETLEAGSATAYIGMSQQGTQTVVFIKQQVLVFITAKQELDSVLLFNYIDSLQ